MLGAQERVERWLTAGIIHTAVFRELTMKRMRVYFDTSVLGGWSNPMKMRKPFDCVEMKRKIQEKIHEETKDLNRAELIDYFHRHAQTGPFAELWKKPSKKVRRTTARRTKA
jgi:hypothetical protein